MRGVWSALVAGTPAPLRVQAKACPRTPHKCGVPRLMRPCGRAPLAGRWSGLSPRAPRRARGGHLSAALGGLSSIIGAFGAVALALDDSRELSPDSDSHKSPELNNANKV